MVLGGGSFKFSASAGPYEKPPKALTGGKSQKEFVLAIMWAHHLIFNGIQISSIQLAEDDSHGSSDVIVKINGQTLGVQLTKLTMNDAVKKIEMANYKVDELLTLLPKNFSIPKPVNVYLYLPNAIKTRKLPFTPDTKKEKLIQCIVSEISANHDKLFGPDPEMVHLTFADDLHGFAEFATISVVPDGMYSTFKGHNSIHLSYEIDNYSWNVEDLDKEIHRIIDRKATGTHDILLIWGEEFELLYQIEKVGNHIRNAISQSPLKEAHFLTFLDRVDMFLTSSRLQFVKKTIEF